MQLQLKLRKIGNSGGFVLPKEALTRLEAGEGDTLVFTETPGGGYRVTPNREDFTHQMAVAEKIAERYRNTLRELAK